MNRFFVNKEVYKERLGICRSCEHYFKLTGNCKVCGCFMRIKASIGVMECPEEYWLKTEEVEEPKEIPEHLKKEVYEVYHIIKTGVVKNQEEKKRFVELYNTLYNGRYKVTTNCGSCLGTMNKGITIMYDKYYGKDKK